MGLVHRQLLLFLLLGLGGTGFASAEPPTTPNTRTGRASAILNLRIHQAPRWVEKHTGKL
jgi:hypothetical protein